MSKPLRIWMTEEYGFREYLWVYPGTKREFLTDWINGMNPYTPSSKGKLHEIQWTSVESLPQTWAIAFTDGEILPEQNSDDFDAVIDYHEQDDTELFIDGMKISGLPGKTNADAVMLLGMIDA